MIFRIALTFTERVPHSPAFIVNSNPSVRGRRTYLSSEGLQLRSEKH